MYNGRTIEAATQVDVGVHKAITKRMYVTSVVLFAVGLAGFIGTFIPYMITDVFDSYLFIIEVCIVLAVVGAVLMMRLRGAYRNTAMRGSALQTFSFHKDGVIVTVLFPGAAQTPYPKMYYTHAKRVRLCGKHHAYLVFNYGRVMYPVYMESLTEMEKYTILSLFGKKPGWIKKRVKYDGPALELEGGQEYRAVSADDIFGMNQPPEDDVFDLSSDKSADAGRKPAQSAGGPKKAPAAKPKEDNPFKDHYWDSPAEDDDPFDLDTSAPLESKDGTAEEGSEPEDEGQDADRKD
ncbi:MAG: hypothetical protein LUD51_03375 [Clostridia bacterium]|nr:hypothetical protein [Clostridia bacterium]